jgi:hypothetical protein
MAVKPPISGSALFVSVIFIDLVIIIIVEIKKREERRKKVFVVDRFALFLLYFILHTTTII